MRATSERVVVKVPGPPVPKGRPRVGRHGPYTPKRTRDYEEHVGWSCRAVGVTLGARAVNVSIELHSRHQLRGDIDNYAKAILDGMQKGGLIDDDRQVGELIVITFVGVTDEHALVVVTPR